jgi:glycerol-3-phosphate acyltransferase PlsX
MRIALDAMGGDHAPGPIVAGAVQAVAADPDLEVVLVGDQTQVEAALVDVGSPHSDRIDVFHCTQAVGMDESPVEALRRKPDNSITRGWQLLAERKVDALVGAGNTGAMVAGGLRLRRFLKNVRRPGIAAVMPTLRGPCVVLDVGANVSPKPEHLFQYGVMGSIFARYILGREYPSIGLMNVGEEEGKGHDLARETHELFCASPLKDHFVGNIEGRDIHRGKCDVVVTDGFTGNVVLKLSEGVFEFVMKMAQQELLATLEVERDKGLRALHNLVSRYDHSEHGGAPLLGIDGICIICHGSSGPKAIANALGVASRYAQAKLNEHIVQELAALTPAGNEAGAG